MKRIVLLGAVILVVVGGWTAGWFYLAGQVRGGIESLAAGTDPAIPVVTCDTLSVAGFPFRFDVTCGGATLVSEDVTARVAELRGTLLVYRPDHVQVFARAPLSVEDAFTGAESRVDWASLESSLRLTNWRVARISVVADEVAWVETLSSEALIASAAQAELHFIDIPERYDPAVGTAALATLARITGLTAPGLEIQAGNATIEADVTGLPADVRKWGEGSFLQRWQANGGAIALKDAQGTDEANFIAATGDVKLDPAGRPEGRIQINSRGLIERIAPNIPENLRPLVLGQEAADGSYSQTLTMQSGVLLSGLMPAGILGSMW